MKNTLIRLTSEKTNGLFENFFNDTITIKPYSSIALQSCNIANFLAPLEINVHNDKIQFIVSRDINDGNSNTLNTIYLKHETYTRTNFINLLTDIQDKMNDVLSVANDLQFGFQINVMVSKQNVLEITMATDKNLNSAWAENDAGSEAEFVNIEVDPNNGFIRSDGLNADNVSSSYAYGLYQFIKSAGVFQCRIDGFSTNAGGAGAIIALVHKDKMEKVNNGTLQKTDIYLGLEFPNDSTQNYIIINDGVSTNSIITPVLFGNANNGQNNDVMEIKVSSGFISCVVYQNGVNGGVGTTIFTASLESKNYRDNDYYPLLANKGSCACKLVSATYDPYSDNIDEIKKTNNSSTIKHLGTTNPTLIPDDALNGKFSIGFEALNIANFLGFDVGAVLPSLKQVFAVRGQDIDEIGHGAIIKGIKRLDKIIQPERFLIELLNINIDSYDSLTSSRRNILATIPLEHRAEDFNTSIIQYEPNSIHYIALNNAESLTLRNINARVITDRFDPIDTEGFNSINLLISQEEKKN